MPFGNIKVKPFPEIWTSPEADQARRCVESCTRNCWMIGSVGHLIRQKIWVPFLWIAKNKLGSLKVVNS
jgi:hypothetical protein